MNDLIRFDGIHSQFTSHPPCLHRWQTSTVHVCPIQLTFITWHHCSSLFTCLSMDFYFFEWNPWFITLFNTFWPVVCSYRKCRQLSIHPGYASSVSTNGINVLHSYQRCDENRYIHLQASINLASTHHHPSSGFLPISTGKSNLVIKEEELCSQ